MGFEFFEERDFKETELGLLPHDWQVVRLGEVANFVRGLSWKKSEEGNKNNGKLILSIPNIENGRINFNAKHNHYLIKKIPNSKKLKVGDILFVGSSGSLKNIGRNVFIDNLPFDEIGFASFTFKASVIEEKIINKFFYYLVNSFWINYENYSKRAADGKYNFQLNDFIDNTFIPLPPLSEQKAIAYVLSTIQEAKEKTEGVIKATRELKKSMMKHLFTYGVYKEGVEWKIGNPETVKVKETEIGTIPEHWQVVRLGEVINQAQYGLSLRGNADKGKYPILRMNNLIDGKIDIKDLRYVDLDDKNFRKFSLKKGELLFNRTNSYELVGKTALFELGGRYVFASYLIRIVCKEEKVNPKFLNYYLNFDKTQARLKTLASRGVSQSNINATKLKSFPIPLPPLPEQQAIANILQAIDDKIQKEEAKKKALENLFKSMLHNLMSGKIRVKSRIE